MKPKPKKIIEESMDDTEPITDDDEAGSEAAGSGADAFDALFGSNASPAKANGKNAPSPVKGLDSSDDENDGNNDTATSADEKNESAASPGRADDDDDDAKDDDDSQNTDDDTANATTNGTANGDEANDDEEGWEVEAIVGHRMKNGRRHYRVRWKNYTEADDTWQVEDDLSW